MKVLWFSNTPANSDEYFNRELAGTGGWMKSLDIAIQDDVDLHVVFYHKQIIANFSYGKTHYYPIPKYKNFWGKLGERFFNTVIDTDHLSVYIDLIQHIQPDIIHIHGTENPFGYIIKHTEVPVVVSIQGNITVCLHKYCSGIERKYLKLKNFDTTNLKTILFPFSFQNSRNKFVRMQKQEEKNLRYCKNIIGRTAWDRRISRIMAPESAYFHNDEILRDDFYQAKWVPQKREKVILHTTSGNNFYKGFETLCMSLYHLNEMAVDVEWSVAGIKKNDLIVKIVKKKLKDKFPYKNLKLLGPLTASDLIERLLATDIYIMPSHIENSPNNLCEAMILGMPCIATFAGGTGTLLKDGEEGLLIQDGDPWAMAGAVLEMKDNYHKAVLMGQSARRRALKRHNKNKIVDELLQIYSTILHPAS